MRRLFLLLALSPVSATVIVQKNGDVITGTILQVKNDRYIFRSPYGQLRIKKSDVSRLILDEKTLELKNISHDNKVVQARLVSEDENTKVYLTDDGKTIRQQQVQSTPAAAPHRFLLSVHGGYGFSAYQQIDTEPPASGSGMPPLAQTLRRGALQAGVDAWYVFSGYLGLGITAGLVSARNSESLNAQGSQISYDSNVRYLSITAAPAAAFSLLGNLGAPGSHDLRLELSSGYSYNTANMELSLRNTPGNFPTAATASGNKHALATEIRLGYLAPLTDNLRLKIAIAYLRIFHTGIYSSQLQGNVPFPNGDGFKRDFDARLSAEATNPQVLTAQLGIEYGF